MFVTHIFTKIRSKKCSIKIIALMNEVNFDASVTQGCDITKRFENAFLPNE